MIFRAISQYKVNWVIKIMIVSDIVILSAAQLFGPIFAIFIADNLAENALEVVGTAAAIYMFARSIVEIPVGIFVDRTASEKDDLLTSVAGVFVIGIVYFFYTRIDTVWQLYALQALLGVATGVAWPGWYSIFTKHIDQTKEAFEWSLYDVASGIGMAAAAVVGSMVVKIFGFDSVFYIASAMALLGALLLLTVKTKIFSSHHHHQL